jgi:hypothetical protein
MIDLTITDRVRYQILHAIITRRPFISAKAWTLMIKFDEKRHEDTKHAA